MVLPIWQNGTPPESGCPQATRATFEMADGRYSIWFIARSHAVAYENAVVAPNQRKRTDRVREAQASAEIVAGVSLTQFVSLARNMDVPRRMEFARACCAAVLTDVWAKRARRLGCDWSVRQGPVAAMRSHGAIVERISSAMLQLPDSVAGFLAGRLYTALLPQEYRKEIGAFYTPPVLVERLLDMAMKRDIAWRAARVIDPACGGAAFLAPVASRIVRSMGSSRAATILEEIEARVHGMEIDPFAAWMSMVLLDLAVLPVCVRAGRRLESVVTVCDALELADDALGRFDLVVGNPPYGKLTLNARLRARYERSLYGHANLYGLFADLGVRLLAPNGILAYVTPTGFLGGEYFKRLRLTLNAHAPLSHAAFVSDRDGVFDDVLQETMLAVFQESSNRKPQRVAVDSLRVDSSMERVDVEEIDSVSLNAPAGGPWVLPRTRTQACLIRRLGDLRHRLADYGYAVATGQLVWNRHKDQLQCSPTKESLPIVWAESVTADGRFVYQASRRSHEPFLRLRSGQQYLVNRRPCVLVQRTTAKEQLRRLVAAAIPESFVREYNGFVVENHLNMIAPTGSSARIDLSTMAALMNSTALDQAFRCINGSVAVSAYELNALPLPDPADLGTLQGLLKEGATSEVIDAAISRIYQFDHELHAEAAHRRAPRGVAA